METNPWSESIRECLDRFKQRYPRLSEGQIARKIGLPQSTLNRIVNDPAKPRLDTVIKIVLNTGNGDKLSDVLNDYDNRLGDKIKNAIAAADRADNINVTPAEVEEILNDPDLFVAHLLCQSQNGITKGVLVGVLGTNGLEAVDKLIGHGLVERRNDRYFSTKVGHVVRSFDHIKRHLSTYAKFYKPSHVGRDRNYVHSHTDFLTKEAIAKLQEAHREFSSKVIDILDDKRNQGDLPVFSVGFMDTFTTDPELLDKEVLQ